MPACAPAFGAAPSAPTPTETGAPTLTGVPQYGRTLSCSTGSWTGSPNHFTYAWRRDGKPVAGQSASTHVVEQADLGHSISCAVTARNSGGEYEVMGLVTGAYEVSFYKRETDYVDQYFNGQPSWLTANTVSVFVPSVTGGIDAALQIGGQISGTVTAEPSGSPLAEIPVCANGSEIGGGCTRTGSDGKYTISGLPSGSYQVEFNRKYPRAANVYATQYYDGKYSRTQADPVTVVAGSTTAGIDASLAIGGQISGTVTAAAGGAGVQDVEVCAHVESSEPPFTFGCSVTDSSGQYAISGLADGDYLVRFSPLHEPLKGIDAGNYVGQLYSGKSQWSEADPVAVTRGATSSGIDAALQTGGGISGNVRDAASGSPLANILVCVESSEDCVLTGANGDYAISGVSNGPHRVLFSSTEGGNYLTQYYNATSPSYEAEWVSVTSGNVTTGIDAAMRAGGRITGRVTDAATMAPLAKVSVCAPAWGFPGSCARTDANGEYTLSDLRTGTYNVEFRTFEGDDHIPLRRSGVPVAEGGVTASVDAAMTPGGKISGRVTDASTGLGIADVGVCAMDHTGNFLWSCATTNAAGGSATSDSNALVVKAPIAVFKLVKRPVFDRRSGNLDFFVRVADPGMFSWRLAFREARKHGGARRHRRAVFSAGSQHVAAGTVEVMAHASAKAIKALKAGRALYLTGKLMFRLDLDGAQATHSESTTVRLPAKRRRRQPPSRMIAS